MYIWMYVSGQFYLYRICYNFIQNLETSELRLEVTQGQQCNDAVS